jgi:hypothetical protein
MFPLEVDAPSYQCSCLTDLGNVRERTDLGNVRERMHKVVVA